VQFYQGPEGIRQMLWNELQAKNELLGYHYQILDAGVGNTFMNRWATEVEMRKLTRRIMFGEAYVASWKARKPQGERIKGISYNYLPAAVFPITHSCDVYDGVTAYYNWQDGEVFGIEIHNKQIADAQRRLLEGLWVQSRPETRF
jgi:hypothetical protein